VSEGEGFIPQKMGKRAFHIITICKIRECYGNEMSAVSRAIHLFIFLLESYGLVFVGFIDMAFVVRK